MVPPTSRQPFRNVQNIQRHDRDDKQVSRTKVQSLAKRFAPSQSDTTCCHHQRTHCRKAKSSALVFPTSTYRVVVHKSLSPGPPNDDFLGRFKSVVATGYPFGTGHLDLRAAIQEGDPEWKDNLCLDEVEFTEDQVNRIRVLIVPPDRYACMDEMGKMILGEQFGRRDKIFGPGYALHVLRTYSEFKHRYAIISLAKKRFNLLFGYTYHLYRNDWWMTHHPRAWRGEKMVAGLAARWKALMKTERKQLGLDDEFSYPAICHFLGEFKRKVENVETYGDPPMLFSF